MAVTACNLRNLNDAPSNPTPPLFHSAVDHIPHSAERTVSNKLARSTTTTTKFRSHHNMYSGKEVNMDEAKQDRQGGTGLYTLGLACCIGISVCGTYTRKAEPGEIRYNAFLAHLADGPAMERTWESLKNKVDLAKRNGLKDLKIQVCVVIPSTLREDKAPGMRWSQKMINEQSRLNYNYINKAAGLRDGGPLSKAEVRQHHINDNVDMLITRDRKMLVIDADVV